MEPDRWLFEYIGMLPRVPRQIGLGFSCDEAPVDHAHPLLLCHGQESVERAPPRTSHVFGADDRPVLPFEPADLPLEIFRPAVVVKGDDVGLAELTLPDVVQVSAIGAGLDTTHATGERLAGIYRPGPLEDLRQERLDPRFLVPQLVFAIGVRVCCSRLIPEVPRENSRVAGVRAEDTLHVPLEPWILTRVGQRSCSRTLDPAGVVDSGNRGML